MHIISKDNKDHNRRKNVDRDHSCYQLDLIQNVIKHERSFGRLISQVILSNFHYAKLEAFLIKKGFRTEANQYAPLYLWKVEIKPANENIGDKDYTVMYHNMLDRNKTENFEKNMQQFNIGSGVPLNNVWTNIQRTEKLVQAFDKKNKK